jgi:hypothetical protein
VDHERALFSNPEPWRKAVKTLAALASAALIAAAGLLWFFSNPVVIAVKLEPLKPSAEIPTFHRVQDDLRRGVDVNSDAVRDGLRNAVLAAADDLKRDPCNPLRKARYIETASKYARAWLSIVPCVGTRTCGPSDGPRLDRAQEAFGSALDHHVREAMKKVHETDIFVEGDFPRDVVVLVAEMAGDGVINPYASARGKEISREFRTPASCRAASLR